MARRAQLVAQGVAVGLVVLLFVLLAWTLLTEEGGDLASAAARGERPAAPDFTLERLDPFAEAGYARPVIREAELTVRDGFLDIRFVRSKGEPKISAIEIRRVR